MTCFVIHCNLLVQKGSNNGKVEALLSKIEFFFGEIEF